MRKRGSNQLDMFAPKAPEPVVETTPAPIHHCHAIGCDTPTPPEWLLCTPHWAMVPPDQQAAVKAAFAPAQCKPGKRPMPSRVWIAAAARARASVAAAEGRDEAAAYLLRVAEMNERSVRPVADATAVDDVTMPEMRAAWESGWKYVHGVRRRERRSR